MLRQSGSGPPIPGPPQGATGQMLNRPLRVQEVPGGIIVPHAPIPSAPGLPPHFYAGVHDRDHQFVPLSELVRTPGPVNFARPFDWFAGRAIPHRPGAAVYAGFAADHFGHFLLESLARLWWVLETGFTGPVCFYSRTGKPPERAHFMQVMTALGLADQIEIVLDPIAFDTVIVPEAAFAIATHAHPACETVFARIARGLDACPRGDEPRRLFLSRAAMRNRRVFGETALAHAFATQGFEVIAPEQIPLEDQIRLFMAADDVAGSQGSALHSLLFRDRPARVTAFARFRDVGQNYHLIDQLKGNEAVIIASDFEMSARRHPGFRLNPHDVIDACVAQGRLNATPPPDAAQIDALLLDEVQALLEFGLHRRVAAQSSNPDMPDARVSKSYLQALAGLDLVHRFSTDRAMSALPHLATAGELDLAALLLLKSLESADTAKARAYMQSAPTAWIATLGRDIHALLDRSARRHDLSIPPQNRHQAGPPK